MPPSQNITKNNEEIQIFLERRGDEISVREEI